VHVSVNVVPDSKGALLNVPLVACAPLQPPEAIQDCALFDCHCSETFPPATMAFESAVSDTVGAATEVDEVVEVLPLLLTPMGLPPHAASPALANSPTAM
jgi:hypothetical protein